MRILIWGYKTATDYQAQKTKVLKVYVERLMDTRLL